MTETHTPEELLRVAEDLLASGNPDVMRAVLMEAVTALETYVYIAVFTALEHSFDPLFVKWLQDKTRRDFDSRLSTLTGLATGAPVDKRSTLWSDYKKAKNIRNEVAHTGRAVTRSEARFVIDNVYEWIKYIEGTLEATEVFEDETLSSRFFAAFARLERILYAVLVGMRDRGVHAHDREAALTELRAAGVIDDAMTQDLLRYWSMRNRLAHVQSVAPTEEEVSRLELLVENLDMRLLEYRAH